MDTIVCTFITAIATVICAVIGWITAKAQKERKAQDEKQTLRDEQRMKEARLQLKMLNANSQLTVGVAMALKRGKCNGEVEDGLKAVTDAHAEYTEFLENIAIDELRGTK